MQYNRDTNTLKKDNGELIKLLDCPIDPDCIELKPIHSSLNKIHCNVCNKNILNINNMNSDQVMAIVQYDPKVCLFFNETAKNISFVDKYVPHDNRVIYTARTIEAMNESVDQGYYPLLIPVKNRSDIGQTIIIHQDSNTGKVAVRNVNYRRDLFTNDLDIHSNSYWYKTDYHEFPVAAYLIPPDLIEGEKVWIDDLIEDFAIHYANYNDVVVRKSGSNATWNEGHFEIDAHETEGPFVLG